MDISPSNSFSRSLWRSWYNYWFDNKSDQISTLITSPPQLHTPIGLGISSISSSSSWFSCMLSSSYKNPKPLWYPRWYFTFPNLFTIYSLINRSSPDILCNNVNTIYFSILHYLRPHQHIPSTKPIQSPSTSLQHTYAKMSILVYLLNRTVWSSNNTYLVVTFFKASRIK